jgi:hypothetical protein
MILGDYIRVKLGFAILTAVLFCGLASLEFPEFLRLTDDTSNDFTLLLSKAPAGHAALKQVTARALADECNDVGQIPQQVSSDPLIPSLHSSIDYLHLLCVHRT